MRFVFSLLLVSLFFFFNDTATTEIYTLSLHDALPIWLGGGHCPAHRPAPLRQSCTHHEPLRSHGRGTRQARSEEHTSELQSLAYLVCRLLLEKKKNILASMEPVVDGG